MSGRLACARRATHPQAASPEIASVGGRRVIRCVQAGQSAADLADAGQQLLPVIQLVVVQPQVLRGRHVCVRRKNCSNKARACKHLDFDCLQRHGTSAESLFTWPHLLLHYLAYVYGARSRIPPFTWLPTCISVSSYALARSRSDANLPPQMEARSGDRRALQRRTNKRLYILKVVKKVGDRPCHDAMEPHAPCIAKQRSETAGT